MRRWEAGGALLTEAVLVDDAERRIGFDATSFDHLDLTGDGVDEPLLITDGADIGIMDGASVFPSSGQLVVHPRTI